MHPQIQEGYKERGLSDIIGKIVRQYLKSNEKVDYSQLLEENA